MSYFHCHIRIGESKRDKNFYLNDKTKEELIETIIKPYILGEQFLFDGYVINPTQIKRIKIAETEHPTRLYVNDHEQRMSQAGIADFATDRPSLPIEQGKDITIEVVDEVKKMITKKVVKPKENTERIDSNKVFIVHGHDLTTMHQLCRILKDDFDLDPIVLSEQPNVGLDTIISKFERLAPECFCAIVLLTPDDKIDSTDKARARQNVIFELGYFLGMLREPDTRKIIILKKGNIEIPSDISGVLYCDFKDSVTEIFYNLKKQFEIWSGK